MFIAATLRFRRFASVVSGPEATVNEHRQPTARKDEIGVAGKTLPVETKAKIRLVCGSADHEFESGVLIPAITSLRRRLSTSSAMTFNRDLDPAGSAERTRLGDGTNHPPVLVNRAIRAAVRTVAASAAFGDSLNLALIRGVTPWIFSTAGSAPAERSALITVTSALFSATK